MTSQNRLWLTLGSFQLKTICVEENTTYSLVFKDLVGWYLLSNRYTVAVQM